ncbi:tRNA 2-selenouridine(34) synthase MnmH, partial [Ruegeria sp. NA]|nr:tRNA 2-selenouridine(34) synthase MnmH [Ruegeria sp. NA]
SKIGSLILPPSLWNALCKAPRVNITASIEARSAYLVRAYDDILSDSDRLRDRLSPLRFHRGHEVVDGWLRLIDAGQKQALTRALMEQHYDPAYTKSRQSRPVQVLASLDVETLDNTGLSNAAAQIESLLDQL